MRVAVVSYHLPHPQGTANGRALFALWDEARRLGHDVTAWCWGVVPAGLDPPEWVMCSAHRDPGGWRRRPATLLRPRWSLAAVGWEPPDDAVAWAEEPESYAAVHGARRRAVTVNHSALLDALAVRRPTAATVQSVRAERRAVRGAEVSVASSRRVARVTGAHTVCPLAVPVPDGPLLPVEEPVAALVADWDWPPNRLALHRLLAAWPHVRAMLPDARLLLAGRGSAPATDGAGGVEVVGPVADVRDLLARAAVLAFPCPSSSGPKVKVLDALAHGVPVVTTPAGVEGLALPPEAAAVTTAERFAATLAAVLADPERRAVMAAAGRRAIREHHSPRAAATARLAAAQRWS